MSLRRRSGECGTQSIHSWGGITGPQTVEDKDHEQMPTAALIIIPETVSCATCGGNDAGREKRRFLGAIRRRS